MSSKLDLLQSIEGSRTPLVCLPPVEYLLGRVTQSFWRQETLNHPKLKDLSRLRSELASLLERIFSSLPYTNADLDKAIEQHYVCESDAVRLYTLLVDFIRDEHSERLILYLPFELVPSEDWNIRSTELRFAIERFKVAYILSWRRLLQEEDCRASFVDGDVPEKEIRTGPLPTVVKAAHLVPILIEKQLITRDEVEDLLLETRHYALWQSLSDALAVVDKDRLASEVDKDEGLHLDADWLAEKITIARNASVEKEAEHLRSKGNNPKARVAWLIKRDTNRIICEFASTVGTAIARNNLEAHVVASRLVASSDVFALNLCLQSLQKALEQMVEGDRQKAHIIYLCEVEERLEQLWLKRTVETEELLSSAWCRLINLGLGSKELLQKRNIHTPRFVSETVSDPQFAEFGHALIRCKELSSLVFPVVILYGSRIKQYGAKSADTDLALFVRPGVPIESRAQIKKLALEAFSPLGIKDAPVDFWITKDGDGCWIQDFPEPDRSRGDSTLAHVLFEGVWTGEENAIRFIYEEVLERFLRITSNEAIRDLWIRELEKDTLQYRLMHTGYHRYFPDRRKKFPNSGRIDGESAFWDSGYRRVASILFVKRVFLPKLDD